MVKYTIGPKAVGREPKKRSREASPDDPIYKSGWMIGGRTSQRSSSATQDAIPQPVKEVNPS